MIQAYKVFPLTGLGITMAFAVAHFFGSFPMSGDWQTVLFFSLAVVSAGNAIMHALRKFSDKFPPIQGAILGAVAGGVLLWMTCTQHVDYMHLSSACAVFVWITAMAWACNMIFLFDAVVFY